MRIVSANRQQVQSLGRHSVGNTGYERRETTDAAIGEAIGGVGEEIVRVRDNRQRQKADLYMQKEDHLFWEQWGGREFFDVSEIPSEFVTEGMQIEGRIASAQVLPQMYEEHIRSSLDRASSMIEIPGSKQEWMLDRERVATGRLTSVQTEANAAIERQILTDQKINYENAINARRPDVALQIANSMLASDDEIAEFKQNARQHAEIISYQDFRREEDIENIINAVEHLKQSPEDYQAGNGTLDPAEQLYWKENLESYLAAFNKKSESNDKAYEQWLDYQVDLFIENLNSGRLRDVNNDEEFRSLVQQLGAWNDANDNRKFKKMLELNDAAVINGYKNRLLIQPREVREEALQRGVNEPSFSSAQNDRLRQTLRTSADEMTRLENDDAMLAWENAGFFGPEGLPAVNFADPASIEQRLSHFKSAQANYGTNLSHGMLTKEEAQTLSDQMNDANIAAQTAFLQNTQEAIGLESTILYKQMALDGNARSFSLAGVASAFGNVHGSDMILRGMDIRKNNPEILKDSQIVDVLKERLWSDESFTQLYWNIPEKQAAVMDTVISSYVGRVSPSGDFDSFDDDAFDAAIMDATGGTFRIGNTVVPNPKYGMPEGSMEQWFDELDKSYVEETSGSPIMITPDGHRIVVSTDTFWDDFQSGEYGLKTSSQTDEYIVMDANGNALLSSRGDGYFKIKYNPNAGKRELPANRRSGRGIGAQ